MEQLTKALHQDLMAQGYKYLLIIDFKHLGSNRVQYIYEPVILPPAVTEHSCTWIQDEMILSVLRNPKGHIDLYVKLPANFEQAH